MVQIEEIGQTLVFTNIHLHTFLFLVQYLAIFLGSRANKYLIQELGIIN